MVPVASNTAVITNASTLGSTVGWSAPIISRLKIRDLPSSPVRLGIATRPWYFTAGSKIKPMIEIAIITNKIPPGTRHFSRPKMTASPSKLIITGKEVNAPSATGKPSIGFLITIPTPLAAISSRNRPIPIPVP